MALLFAGCDENGPQLFHLDPSGTFLQHDAKAIGSASEGAQQALQEVFHKVESVMSIIIFYHQYLNINQRLLFFFQSMSLQEACKEALKILKQVMEEKLNSTNVEVRLSLVGRGDGEFNYFYFVYDCHSLLFK